MRRRKSKYQSGGLYATNKKGYVDSVLSANKNLEWVKRLYEQNPQTLQIPGEPFPSTHYMAEGDSTVYPSIVNINGKLQYLGDKAGDYAAKTNTGIKFPNEQQAAWFAENGYKLGTGVLPKKQMGGMDLQSILGYSQGSPYAGNPYLDIHTPEGLIDMSNTPIDLMGIDNKGNKKKMKAGRKNPYRFEGDVVREIPMQLGGASRTDSLAVYNQNNKVLNFYRNKAYHADIPNYDLGNMDVFAENERGQKEVIQDIGKGIVTATPKGRRVINLKEYYQKVDNNRYFQREDAHAILNTDAPFQLFDKRIKPGAYYGFDYIDGTSKLHGDGVSVYGYDPVLVKPVDLLTPSERALRIKRYGNKSGIQTSKKPAQPIKGSENTYLSESEYNKKYPPIYLTNPKDPRIGQYAEKGNQYLYKKPEIGTIVKRDPKGFMPEFNQPDIPISGAPTANVNIPGLPNPENPYSKPTKWSYTFPTGEYNGQKTVYFPDQGTWENFIKDKKVNSQQGADYGSALGYFKKGGLTEAQYMTMRGALQTAHHNKMGGRLQMGGNPFKNQLLNFLYDDSSSDMYNAEPEAAPQEQPKPQQQADDSEERRRMNDAEDYNTAMQIAMAYEGNPYTNSGVPIYQSDHPFRAANEDLYTASKSLEGMSYGFGQEGQNGKIDCSGAVCRMLGIPRTTSEEIVANSTNFRQFTGDLSTIKEGTVIGVNSGNRPWEGQRKYGIDHVLLVVKNPKTGKLETKSSSGSKGFHTESLEQSLKTYGKYNLYLGDYK